MDLHWSSIFLDNETCDKNAIWTQEHKKHCTMSGVVEYLIENLLCFFKKYDAVLATADYTL